MLEKRPSLCSFDVLHAPSFGARSDATRSKIKMDVATVAREARVQSGSIIQRKINASRLWTSTNSDFKIEALFELL